MASVSRRPGAPTSPGPQTSMSPPPRTTSTGHRLSSFTGPEPARPCALAAGSRRAGGHGDRLDRSYEALASGRGRARAVRRLPARLPDARRPAGHVLRARMRGRRGGAHDLRPLQRLLRRPDREEAAQPLPPGHRRALVRHRRLQPGLPLLPELGHQQVARGRHARRRRRRRSDSAGRARAARLPKRRVHLQRPGDLHRVRDGRRRRLPARGSRRWPSPPATCAPRPRTEFYPTWTRRTST